MTSHGRHVKTKEKIVIDYVDQEITANRLVPGQRLVEADIGKALNISNSAIRAAFRTLAARGILEILPNRGASIRQINLTELWELIEYRGGLSVSLALCAARYMNEDRHRKSIVAAMRKIENSAKNADMFEISSSAQSYWDTLGELGRNRLINERIQDPIVSHFLHRSVQLEMNAAQIRKMAARMTHNFSSTTEALLELNAQKAAQGMIQNILDWHETLDVENRIGR